MWETVGFGRLEDVAMSRAEFVSGGVFFVHFCVCSVRGRSFVYVLRFEI